VRRSRIEAAIGRGATVVELKATLGCGTVCGSCVPELKRLCERPAATAVPSAETPPTAVVQAPPRARLR
jgi:assimilatory nitrate reductase catalytic subunit